MAIDREKIQRAADRLVRQNKLQAAAEQYKILLKDSPNDLATINKIGDLLSRAGHVPEALSHFQKIADVYTQGGFFLKAIAIYKKIVKLDPLQAGAMQRLGDLYGRQDLFSEAREMYLQAARLLSSRHETARAREIYEKLLKLEPDRVETRVALAEILQSAGESLRASSELVTAACLLASRGRKNEGERLLVKAVGAAGEDPSACAGMAREVLEAHGAEVAASFAEWLWRKHPGSAEVADVLVESCLMSRREQEAEEVAKTAFSRTESPGAMTLFVLARLHARQGRKEQAVTAAAQASDDLVARSRVPKAAAVLEEMITLVPGSPPLLSRRLEVARASGDKAAARIALEGLVQAHRAAGRKEDAARALAQLAEVDPASPLLMPPAREPEKRVAPAPVVAGKGAPPAMEEEFVREHLAEAESLANYGLADKAFEQLETILQRFPGHVETRRQLKELMLRAGRRSEAVTQSLAIAEALVLQGMEGEAALELASASKLDPENARVARASATLRGRVSRGAGPPPPPPGLAPADVEVHLEEEPAAAAAADAMDGGLLDLSGDIAESLARALGETAPVEAPEEERQTLDEVLQSFREKVKEEVEAEDYGTHYELGIAYKEMGLLDEAISEFEHASRSQDRLVESCNMMAVCLREKGESKGAEQWYRRALESPAAHGGADLRLGLAYDLGDLLAHRQDWKGALQAFEEVFRQNRGYRDVLDRLKEARERAG